MASTSPATTDAKSEFLKLFWTLAESDVTTRTLAATQLINYLQSSSSPSSTNDATSDDDAVQYTLKRLVRGLASSRDAARQGFSAALASLLAAFPQQLPLTNALDLVAKAMATSAAMKPMEQREHMFGKLFGLLAIHRSGRLAGDDDTTVAVLQHLADMASWKHWLREACFEALLAVLASDVSPSLFTSRVASIFAPLLQASGDGAVLNADQVALALGVHQYVTTHSIATNKLPADFPATNLVRRKHLHALVEPLKHSTRCFPRVHGAWLALFGSVRTAHGDKLDAELFQEAWTVLVENVLLAPATATHERKGLALKLFETVVLGTDLPSPVLRATLTPNLVKCLYNNTLAKKTYLHDAAKHTLHAFAVQQPAEFFHFMQREFTTPMPALVDGNDDEDNDNTELQAAVKSGGFDAIIAIEEERERLAARARKFAAVRLWAIEHMTSALVEKLTQQPTEATKDTESALRFLTVHALFTVGGSTTSAPAKTKAKSKKANKDDDAVETLVAPSPALSPAVRQALVKKLFSLVSVQLSSAEHETPLALAFAIATQQLDANTFPLRTPLEEGDDLVANARRHVAALRKKRGEPQPTDDAFALLFMSGVLQLLAGEDQQHSLADLEQCFAALQAKPKAAKATKKTSKKAKAEEPEEPEVDAVVVLTDLLLGLLSQDSSAMREIVAHVFRALVPLMTTASLQTLVAAVAPATAEPEEETNGKPREGDEEEDDEEGDEDMEEAEEEEEEEEDIVLTSASDIADALRDDANLAELHREDQTLSAIVGQVKDKARAKKDAKKFRLGVLHFKLRVVDLLATYATATFKSSASSASVMPLVLPLFESLAAIAGSDVEQRVLKERLQSVLLHKFLKGLAGAQDDAVAPRTREDRQLTVSALEKVVEVLTTKALDKELASKVGTAVVVQLVRVSLAGSDVDNEVLQAVRELFRRTSVEVFTRKHAKFPRATFDELVTKHATLAARLLLAPLAAIAEASSSSASSSTDVKPAVDEFSKTEVFRLLAALVKSKHVSELEDVRALFTQHRGQVLHALEAVLRQPSAKATADNDDGEDKAKGQAKNELKAKRLKVVLSCALQLVRTWRDVEAPVSELASLVSVLEALETNSPVVKSMAKQVVQAVSGSEDEAAETQEKKTATKRKPVEAKAKASPSKKAKTTTTTTSTKATKQTKPTKRKRSNSTADDHA